MQEDELTCNICFEYYGEDSRTPKILSCGHTFCCLCISSILGSSKVCATCRKPIKYKTLTEIPVNFALKHLAENDEHTGTCKEHKSQENWECIECKKIICGSCVMLYHRECKTKYLEEHDIERRKKLMKQIDKAQKILAKYLEFLNTKFDGLKNKSASVQTIILDLKEQLQKAEKDFEDVQSEVTETEKEQQNVVDLQKTLLNFSSGEESIRTTETDSLNSLFEETQSKLKKMNLIEIQIKTIVDETHVDEPTAPPFESSFDAYLESPEECNYQNSSTSFASSSIQDQQDACRTEQNRVTAYSASNTNFSAGLAIIDANDWIRKRLTKFSNYHANEGVLEAKYYIEDQYYNKSLIKIESFHTHNQKLEGQYLQPIQNVLSNMECEHNKTPNEVYLEICAGSTGTSVGELRIEVNALNSRGLNFILMVSGFLMQSFQNSCFREVDGEVIKGGFILDRNKKEVPLCNVVNCANTGDRNDPTPQAGYVYGEEMKYKYKGSQFYICTTNNYSGGELHRKTKFGKITKGINILRKINDTCYVNKCGMVLYSK